MEMRLANHTQILLLVLLALVACILFGWISGTPPLWIAYNIIGAVLSVGLLLGIVVLVRRLFRLRKKGR